jgi:hypothetical protein
LSEGLEIGHENEVKDPAASTENGGLELQTLNSPCRSQGEGQEADLRSHRNAGTHVTVLKERRIAGIVEAARPKALRDFDQIPMHSRDLIRQARRIAPQLADKNVAFVGDYDGTSIVLALLSKLGLARPRRMLLLDFDERILQAYAELAERYRFGNLLGFSLYNVFEPLPHGLNGQFDWFYTNPPYGSNNHGASGRLFITRGCELVHPTNGRGCIILPDDPVREWSQRGMLETQQFLSEHGWLVREKSLGLHGYMLDDDPSLRSSQMIISRVGGGSKWPVMPWSGRKVDSREIPWFYGRTVSPPYPTYISPFDQAFEVKSSQADAA